MKINERVRFIGKSDQGYISIRPQAGLYVDDKPIEDICGLTGVELFDNAPKNMWRECPDQMPTAAGGLDDDPTQHRRAIHDMLQERRGIHPAAKNDPRNWWLD